MGNSSETQDKILDAAIIHFARNGYYGTKTADIARDAGVSEGAVFKYYSTKKDILRGVMDKIIHKILPEIVLGPENDFQRLIQSEDPREEIKSFIKVRIEKISMNINAFRILMTELQYHEDIMEEFKDQVILKIINIVEEFFRLGSERGVFRQIDPHIAGRSLMGMMNVIVLESVVFRKPMELEKELDAVLDIYMNGVFAKKEV